MWRVAMLLVVATGCANVGSLEPAPVELAHVSLAEQTPHEHAAVDGVPAHCALGGAAGMARTVYLPPALPKVLVGAAEAAVAAWNEAAGVQMFEAVRADMPAEALWAIEVVVDPSLAELDRDGSLFEMGNSSVLVVRDAGDELMVELVMHELGHAIGLEHDDGASVMMDPRSSAVITAAQATYVAGCY